jgi:hypothetical protein
MLLFCDYGPILTCEKAAAEATKREKTAIFMVDLVLLLRLSEITVTMGWRNKTEQKILTVDNEYVLPRKNEFNFPILGKKPSTVYVITGYELDILFG